MNNAEQTQDNVKDIDKLTPGPKTITLNGHEIEVRPIENETFLKAAAEAEKSGDSDMELFIRLGAKVLQENGWDVSPKELAEGRGIILPLINAIQEVNELTDFSEEEMREKLMS